MPDIKVTAELTALITASSGETSTEKWLCEGGSVDDTVDVADIAAALIGTVRADVYGWSLQPKKIPPAGRSITDTATVPQMIRSMFAGPPAPRGASVELILVLVVDGVLANRWSSRSSSPTANARQQIREQAGPLTNAAKRWLRTSAAVEKIRGPYQETTA